MTTLVKHGLEEAGEFTEAEDHVRRAIAVYTQVFGADHYNLGGAYEILGRLMARQQRFPEAEAYLRKALAVLEPFGPTHPRRAFALRELVSVLYQTDRSSEAGQLEQDVAAITAAAQQPFVQQTARHDNMRNQGVRCERRGFVSVWAGNFASVEEAEAYFGMPDEIGVYLPPEGFARDFGLEDVPEAALEANFQQVPPRPLRELLRDATFSASFIEQAVAAACRLDILAAQGVALLYDFDYHVEPDRQNAGPLRFIGSFPFTGTTVLPVRDPRITVRDVMDDVL